MHNIMGALKYEIHTSVFVKKEGASWERSHVYSNIGKVSLQRKQADELGWTFNRNFHVAVIFSSAMPKKLGSDYQGSPICE